MIIKIKKLNRISYPVGEYIDENITSIKIMADSLYNFFGSYKAINLFCTGSSGAIIASIISYLLKEKNIDTRIIYIKKEGEHSHSSYNDDLDTMGINIFVDDFIVTGSTIHRALKAFPKVKYDCLCVSYIQDICSSSLKDLLEKNFKLILSSNTFHKC